MPSVSKLNEVKQVQDDLIESDERQTKMMNENRLSDDNFLTNIRMEVLIQSITRRSCSPKLMVDE